MKGLFPLPPQITFTPYAFLHAFFRSLQPPGPLILDATLQPRMQLRSARSLRRSYLEWVEAQIESYKESVPRTDLLGLADEVIEELRVNQEGQYQLTELLLCTAVDRKIFRLLRLPGYRSWCAGNRSG